MPRRRRSSRHLIRDEPATWFSRPQLVNMLTVPVITVIIGLTGWYFLTSDALKRHEVEISAIKAASRLSTEEDRKAREESRKAFMDNQVSLASVLGKIDARLTVNEKQQDLTNSTLSKISDELSRLSRGTPK